MNVRDKTPLSILIAEDEEELRSVLCMLLETRGLKVYSAQNGNEAYDILLKNKIDVVISDVRMPVCDGLELLDKIKATHSISPAVVLVTGFAEVTKEEVCRRGALTLLQKPYSFESLMGLLDGFMTGTEFFKKVPA